jgi:serine/threonine protein kinase
VNRIHLEQHFTTIDFRIYHLQIQRLDLLHRVTALVAKVHAAQWVVGDLKAANIGVFPRGLVGYALKFIDVDSFRSELQPLSAEFGAAAFTFETCAPEVARRQRRGCSAQSDTWALGMIGVFVVCGKSYFSESDKSDDARAQQCLVDPAWTLSRHTLGEKMRRGEWQFHFASVGSVARSHVTSFLSCLLVCANNTNLTVDLTFHSFYLSHSGAKLAHALPCH